VGFLNVSARLHSIWLCCASVWQERTSRVFKQKDESLQHLLDKIKLQSYWWLQTIASILL